VETDNKMNIATIAIIAIIIEQLKQVSCYVIIYLGSQAPIVEQAPSSKSTLTPATC